MTKNLKFIVLRLKPYYKKCLYILHFSTDLLTQASKNFLYKSKKFYAGTKNLYRHKKRCSSSLHLFLLEA